jgi:hypothetical protein
MADAQHPAPGALTPGGRGGVEPAHDWRQDLPGSHGRDYLAGQRDPSKPRTTPAAAVLRENRNPAR